MSCNCTVFIVCLLFKMATFQERKIEYLEKLVRDNRIESQAIDLRKSNVYVNDNAYEIFFYDNATSFPGEIGYHENTLIKLYTCLNCEFAKWTRVELFKIARNHPAVFGHRYDNTVFRGRFDDFVVKFHRIADKTDRFVDVLFNMTDPIGSRTVDESLLMELLALRFNIDHMETLRDPNVRDDDASSGNGLSRKVLQTVLKTANGIQTYMSLNCGVATFDDRKTFEPGLEERPDEIESKGVLGDIGPLNSESSVENRCSLDRMRLSDVLKDGNGFFHGMTYVEISVGCDGNVLLKDVLDNIGTARDLEVIHWYQHFVLKITVYLSCEKTVKFLGDYNTDRRVPTTITTPFRRVVSALFSEPVGVPGGVIESFEIFARKTRLSESEVRFVIGEMNTYSDDLKRSANLNAGSYREKNVLLNKNPFEELLRCTLDVYSAEIEVKIDDYKCFVRLFRLLNAECGSYYTPFVMNYEKITDFVVDSGSRDRTTNDDESDWARRSGVIRHLKNAYNGTNTTSVFYDVETDGKNTNPTKSPLVINAGCEFARSAIEYCFYIVRKYKKDEHSEKFSAAFRELREIRDALLAATDVCPDHHFRKIAHQLTPYVDVLEGKFTSALTADGLIVRIVSLFVNAFNYYCLEYCLPPRYTIVLSNEHYTNTMATNVLFDEDHGHLLGTVNSTNRLTVEGGNDKNLVDIGVLYKTYGNDSRKRIEYRKIVRFEWNGKQSSVREIYVNIVSTVVQPSCFYAFFDTLFKFHLATIYYEINKFNRTNKNTVKNVAHCESFKNVAENILKKNEFPNQFKSIVERLDDYLIMIFERICAGSSDHETEVRDLEIRITDNFKKHSFCVNTEKTTDDDQSKNDKNNSSVIGPVRDVGHVRNEISSRAPSKIFYTELE